MDLAGEVTVTPSRPGALVRVLNGSGWLVDEVLAAADLEQGRAPSMLALISGVGMIELLRPRRSKRLPRQFVLAITAERVVAFRAACHGGGEEGPYTVRIRAGELASWPRASVRLLDVPDGMRSKGATLAIAGEEPFPVRRARLNRDRGGDELFALLAA